MRGTGYNIRTKAGRVKLKVLADVIRRVVEAPLSSRISARTVPGSCALAIRWRSANSRIGRAAAGL